jgi:DNA-binding NtrC family response regulator
MSLDIGVLQRSVVLASADAGFRARLRESLVGMRWKVREAAGGAEAMAQMEEQMPEILLVDSWLPDLEVTEFIGDICSLFPGVDLLRTDGETGVGGVRSPRRHELLHALREAQEAPKTDTVAWANAPVSVPSYGGIRGANVVKDIEFAVDALVDEEVSMEELAAMVGSQLLPDELEGERTSTEVGGAKPAVAIPEMIGTSEPMMELARMIRLVAPRSTTVLIEGETGTGKEVVAKAIHRLSARSQKPFAVLNCAAIPEALLEAELFGHTRGSVYGGGDVADGEDRGGEWRNAVSG